MNQVHLQQQIGVVVSNLAFWTCLSFPLVTWFYWNWRDSWWGRNIVIMDLLVALALLGGVLRADLGLTADPVLFGWVTLVSVGLVPVVVVQRTLLIWRAQLSEVGRQKVRVKDSDNA